MWASSVNTITNGNAQNRIGTGVLSKCCMKVWNVKGLLIFYVDQNEVIIARFRIALHIVGDVGDYHIQHSSRSFWDKICLILAVSSISSFTRFSSPTLAIEK